ncbi:hypothetical protein BN2475_1130001 [Paraburkholderia ribeironis]|uniref:Uncharacterized protein n=1 Tax=Paraburkholderia ribeironis TaxID=1247936 RepID=A0A1N7SMT7_9BURK|nr:hypothetical protein [Paraburkholderia ribeironis]SIT48754.1 hypothetical protein BN2475_1130001 [Paraburkholderia ribeironis]
MAWTPDESPAVTLGRLNVATPELVEQELAEMARCMVAEPAKTVLPEGLCTLLALRREPLIDLAIAHYGDPQEAHATYMRSVAGTGDLIFDKAIRIAYLGNRTGQFDGLLLSDDELRHLAVNGDKEEVSAACKNPTTQSVLLNLFWRSSLYEGVPLERINQLLKATSTNTFFRTPDWDLWSWGTIRHDIFRGLLRTIIDAPVDSSWALTIVMLLGEILPEDAPAADVDPIAAMDRWRDANLRDHRGAEEQGVFTGLPLAEEVRCLTAIVFCRRFDETTFKPWGALDDEDLARRCAFYATGKMPVEACEAALARDDEAAAAALIRNSAAMRDDATRRAIEEHCRGDMYNAYERMCERLRSRGSLSEPRSMSARDQERVSCERAEPEKVTRNDIKALDIRFAELRLALTDLRIDGFRQTALIAVVIIIASIAVARCHG